MNHIYVNPQSAPLKYIQTNVKTISTVCEILYQKIDKYHNPNVHLIAKKLSMADIQRALFSVMRLRIGKRPEQLVNKT